MGYSSTVKGTVNKAFKMLKDLAVDVTLSSQSNTGFDFATNAVNAVAATSKPIRALPITKQRASSDSTLIQTFLIKASDLSDPSGYDTITVSDTNHTAYGVWKIVPPASNDGYTVNITVAREA